MISCQKILTYKEPKLLPTINITDQLSLNTWLDLRKLAVDYGRKYFRRHEIFTPVLFILGILSFIGFFVMLVVSTNSFGESAQVEVAKTRLLLLLNSLVMFYLFFGLLYQGAGINFEFSEHQQILRKNKQIFNDLIFFKEFYFGEHIQKIKSPGNQDKRDNGEEDESSEKDQIDKVLHARRLLEEDFGADSVEEIE